MCYVTASFTAIAIYTYYNGIIDHSGIDFKAPWWQPWRPDTIFHDNHHQYFHVNFGFNCFIWDKVCCLYSIFLHLKCLLIATTIKFIRFLFWIKDDSRRENGNLRVMIIYLHRVCVVGGLKSALTFGSCDHGWPNSWNEINTSIK